MDKLCKPTKGHPYPSSLTPPANATFDYSSRSKFENRRSKKYSFSWVLLTRAPPPEWFSFIRNSLLTAYQSFAYLIKSGERGETTE